VYRILWAEDDLGSYDSYREILGTFLSLRGLPFEIYHAIDGNAVYRYLTPKLGVDLLVLDIDMPNWNGFQAARHIWANFEGIPILVVTGNAHAADIRNELDTMLLEGAIQGYFHGEDSEEWCAAIVDILGKGPISILHLSDIHFGRFHGLSQASVRLEDLICTQLESLIDSPRVDLLVVSGDFCSEGLTKEFQQTADFLNRVSQRFSVSKDRVILVPGNHDIFRKEEEDRRFKKFVEFIYAFYADAEGGLARFRALLDPSPGRFESESLAADALFSISIFDDLRLVIIGLNSVVAREDFWDSGEIEGSQLLKVESELERLTRPRSDYFRLAVFHHHLFEVPTIYQAGSAERVVASQGLILRHLIRHKVRLVLHGHSHYGAGYKYLPYFFDEPRNSPEPIFVFSTGTLGGDHRASSQYSYQCNFLQLIREGSGVARGSLTPLRLLDDSLAWQKLPAIAFDLTP